jgi:MFS family permease
MLNQVGFKGKRFPLGPIRPCNAVGFGRLSRSIKAQMAPTSTIHKDPVLPNAEFVRFELVRALFFASGFAALLYQIAWQRTLFGWYGVDLDSVSTIVSVFMLGLGIGAIVGGWISDLLHRHRILAFSLIELAIGAFGLFSLEVIDSIGRSFAPTSIALLVALTFGLFIVPTCAMGATLPVLVTELVERTQSVGRSTGSLYFINTLGAAFGSFASGFVLLEIGGLDLLIAVAATLNFLVSIIAFGVFRRGQ